jgi:spore coat polysaccharide biosynthesis protein SpsF
LPRTVAVIQARMGSSRLPGKVLADLGGKPMLERVVRRVERARALDHVVVATSTDPRDEVIVHACERLGVASFRGSEDDVLDRYYAAARASSADVVVRVTSDCPLIEGEVIDRVVATRRDAGADYASNSLVRTYPRGLDAEAFTFGALGVAWREAREPYERVHATPYLYRHPELFKLVNVAHDEDESAHRWTVDTPEDLDLVRHLFARGDGDPSWRRLLEVVAREGRLADINRHVKQKSLEDL